LYVTVGSSSHCVLEMSIYLKYISQKIYIKIYLLYVSPFGIQNIFSADRQGSPQRERESEKKTKIKKTKNTVTRYCTRRDDLDDDDYPGVTGPSIHSSVRPFGPFFFCCLFKKQMKIIILDQVPFCPASTNEVHRS